MVRLRDFPCSNALFRGGGKIMNPSFFLGGFDITCKSDASEFQSAFGSFEW